MTREEHKQIINQIMQNPTDQAGLSTLLTQLSEDYETVLTEGETHKGTAEKLTADNESLRNANMQLFLKVGQVEKPQVPPTTPTTNETPNGGTDKELSFENLFNEKGDLI